MGRRVLDGFLLRYKVCIVCTELGVNLDVLSSPLYNGLIDRQF